MVHVNKWKELQTTFITQEGGIRARRQGAGGVLVDMRRRGNKRERVNFIISGGNQRGPKKGP